MKFVLALGALGAALALSPVSVPAGAPSARDLGGVEPAPSVRSDGGEASEAPPPLVPRPAAEPLTVLMRTGHWFVYPRGCQTVTERRDVVIHFHGAQVTTIPRFLASRLDAVLVIINLGIGSGPYSDAFALRSQVDELLSRIESSIGRQCGFAPAPITRLALSSWSAGYGATEQVLRFRPDRVDAVLLADGLHVGFVDHEHRKADPSKLGVFMAFAQRASRGEKLMAITHSAIRPLEYASAAETALVLSEAAHAPTWPVAGGNHGMWQLTAARRGEFYVEGYAGNDKAAHSQHLYAIGETSFARLRDYWERAHVRSS